MLSTAVLPYALGQANSYPDAHQGADLALLATRQLRNTNVHSHPGGDPGGSMCEALGLVYRPKRNPLVECCLNKSTSTLVIRVMHRYASSYQLESSYYYSCSTTQHSSTCNLDSRSTHDSTGRPLAASFKGLIRCAGCHASHTRDGRCNVTLLLNLVRLVRWLLIRYLYAKFSTKFSTLITQCRCHCVCTHTHTPCTIVNTVFLTMRKSRIL